MTSSAGRPAVREMGRTVHPELAAAVLDALTPHPARPAATEARRLLAAGQPVPELLHRELLAALYGCGWPAVREAGRRLFAAPRDPLLRSLVAGADVAEAFARAWLVEPWLYAGHRTRVVVGPGELTVHHLAYLGREPLLAETVFVCAVHTAGVAAITGGPVRAVLLADDGRELPLTAAWRGSVPEAVRGWRLHWTAAQPTAAQPTAAQPTAAQPTAAQAAPGERPLTEAARRAIAADPAAPWRVASLADALGVAPRTLQRGFARAGTTFRAELAAVRLDVAGHLIRRTRLPLAEIAATAGFTDHPHLTRRFRERYGRTPTAFRHDEQ